MKNTPSQIFQDQMGRSVELSFPPQRIISLVPSQTELLHDLGLKEEVVGITKFCLYPNTWFREKRRVGGTKTYHMDRIEALQPDLIIGNKEENEKEQIETLAQRYPVWMSDIYTLSDALDMITQVGQLVHREAPAQVLAEQIRQQFQTLQQEKKKTYRAAYFIWRKPYMVAGSSTFIQEMMQRAGFSNVFASEERYPEINLAELANRQPEVILLSSEPYPFQEKHFAEFQEFCPQAKIILVDGELFSWYGSRLLHSVRYFQTLNQQFS